MSVLALSDPDCGDPAGFPGTDSFPAETGRKEETSLPDPEIPDHADRYAARYADTSAAGSGSVYYPDRTFPEKNVAGRAAAALEYPERRYVGSGAEAGPLEPI